MQARTWCFTDFTLAEMDWQAIDSTYLCYGREICPDTQRPHLQGMITFAKPKRLAAVKKVNATCHWEPTHDIPASITYCKKEGDWFESGTPPVQGKRNDLDAVYALIAEGGCAKSVAAAHPAAYIKYHAGIEKLIALQVEHREDGVREVNWYYGPTGSGKSRRAFEEAGPDAYEFSATGKFWNGYTGQTCVVFDDFRPDQIPFALLLRFLDRYRATVEVKGSSYPLAATRFWITAPDSPQDMYTGHNHTTGASWDRENIQQLVRRCTNIHCFNIASIFM